MKSAIDLQKVIAADQDHLIHPLFHPNDWANPFVWVSGEGSMIRSGTGANSSTAFPGLWNVSAGHGRKELAKQRRDKWNSSHLYRATSEIRTCPPCSLPRKIASLCYPSIQHFFFTSGGGESNESAFKTARFFWITQGKPEKTKIISREFAYHGVTMPR
jgi:adenosylmethionine-8-amino-7-oxononanoate aminotransferase